MLILKWVELLAILTSGIFAGAAIYINVAEHPARIACGTDAAIKEFQQSYPRAAKMQALLALLGALFGLIAWFLGAGTSWLVGSTAMALIIPFTLIVIFPTNAILLDPRANSMPEVEAHQLLRKWARLHAVRSIVSSLAFVCFVVGLLAS